MVTLTIDRKQITVPEGTTILDAAKSAGIPIPSLCYLREVNEIGACRVCMVELEGKEKLITACNNVVEEGMVLYTNSPKVREVRRTNVEFILSQHDSHCASCVRSGNCSLQTIANDLGITSEPYEKVLTNTPWKKDFPLIRDYAKCIKCMRCVQICDKVQSLNVWDISNTGSHTTVAPAVRAAWGEALGLPREKATMGRLVAAMRRIGFDHIFDTNFSADLTIMEEGSEFMARMKNHSLDRYPMFTSCCPGWVRFLKSQYPELVPQLSSAKSPQQMFGSVIKSYYAELLGVEPEKIFSVSVMPCTAKKAEAELSTMDSAGAGQDVDLVLTTREIVRMIRAEHIQVENLPEEACDLPLGIGTGAGVIFGATGGVMEAALRTAAYLATGKNPDPDAFKDVRGMDGWKEATFDLAGTPVRVAVASGLGNARRLIRALRRGDVHYDFVEVMACPGGCVGGGGQPIHDGEELAEVRAGNLYGLDRISNLRFSHENPSIQKIYREYFQQPMSEKAHHLLHTDHEAWEMPQAPALELDPSEYM